MVTGDETQDRVHARQVLYQLSYTSSPAFLVLNNGAALGRQGGLQDVKHLCIYQVLRRCWGVGYSEVERKGHLFPRARSESEFKLHRFLDWDFEPAQGHF